MEGKAMTRNSDLERIKAVVHRRGTPTRPQINPIVAEVRTPDNLGIQPPDPDLAFYDDFFLMVEWTFAVPYSELEKFHTFLKDNEQFIAETSSETTQDGARYRGTWWVFGHGPSTYRTLWLYKNEQAITNLKVGLRTSENFRKAMKGLRSFWAKDPGRAEQLYQPAALFTDLKQASMVGQQVDPLVELMLEP
jgi:hypothetical protein